MNTFTNKLLQKLIIGGAGLALIAGTAKLYNFIAPSDLQVQIAFAVAVLSYITYKLVKKN